MSHKVNWSGQVDVDVPATPEQVWAVLTDVTRIGEWSHECHTAQWLGGAEAAAIGAQFLGHNEFRTNKWSKTCTITDVQPVRRFVYETSSSFKDPGATRWTFTLEPTASGCHLTQSFQIIKLAKIAEWIMAKKVPEHVDRSQALHEDLERLSSLATKTPAATDADNSHA